MIVGQNGTIQVEMLQVYSAFLLRTVQIDLYRPANLPAGTPLSLLLLNDGQDLQQLPFPFLFHSLNSAGMLEPLVCAGIHTGQNRLLEYGTAGVPDYGGRGLMAGLYHRFILEELLPLLLRHLELSAFRAVAAAGFSLGGLSALDLVWRHPQEFGCAGVFSGSLWWRSRALDQGYDEDHDRIMHAQVRNGSFVPGLRFYFTTGSLDETADRNGNGIIDSIDDTLALIAELEQKGYRQGKDIRYTNYEDGRHDIATWGRALPQFLLWGWGKGAEAGEGLKS